MTAERFLGIAALLFAIPVAAQEHDRMDDSGEHESRIDTTVALERGGTVNLSLMSGAIVVNGWDREQAKIVATSEHGAIRLDASPRRVELSVHGRRGRMGDARYQLSVPVGTRVLMNSVSGDLSVTAVRGEVEARTVSGELVITDAADRIEFENVSGSVRGSGLAGDVRGSVISGDLSLMRVSGEVDVETVSGDITLGGVRSKRVQVETVSGDVDYDGSVDSGGRYEFNSHSGELVLTLPESAGGVVSVETFSGEIDSDFPITLQPGERDSREHGRRFEFTFGGGGARITTQTFSGDIVIRRGSRRGDRKGD